MSDFALPFTVRGDSIIGRIWAVLAVTFPLVGRWLAETVSRARQVVLYLGGLASICYGLWQITPALGWVAVGVSCLLLEALTTERPEGR